MIAEKIETIAQSETSVWDSTRTEFKGYANDYYTTLKSQYATLNSQMLAVKREMAQVRTFIGNRVAKPVASTGVSSAWQAPKAVAKTTFGYGSKTWLLLAWFADHREETMTAKQGLGSFKRFNADVFILLGAGFVSRLGRGSYRITDAGLSYYNNYAQNI